MNTLITKFSETTIRMTQEISIKLDMAQWYRADGDCLCPACGQPYKRHKNIEENEWITVLCTGDLVKL